MPGDSPEGGIDFVAVTQLNNTRSVYFHDEFVIPVKQDI